MNDRLNQWQHFLERDEEDAPVRRDEAKSYLEHHNIMQLFNDLTSSPVYHRPAHPRKFMIEQIEKIRPARERSLYKPLQLKKKYANAIYDMLDPIDRDSCPKLAPQCLDNCFNDSSSGSDQRCCKNDCGKQQCYDVNGESGSRPVMNPPSCPYFDSARTCAVKPPTDCKPGTTCPDGSLCCEYECGARGVSPSCALGTLSSSVCLGSPSALNSAMLRTSAKLVRSVVALHAVGESVYP